MDIEKLAADITAVVLAGEGQILIETNLLAAVVLVTEVCAVLLQRDVFG